jgi:hypothetical protein
MTAALTHHLTHLARKIGSIPGTLRAPARRCLHAGLLLALAPLSQAQVLPTTLQLPNASGPTTWSSGVITKTAAQTITAAGTNGTLPINGTAQVTFAAGTQISLEDGFSASSTNGATFHATIVPIITSTSPLPSGAVGSAYAVALGATGGVAPYVWLIASGALPPGLALSPAGVISGTPTTAGTYTPTIRVAGTDGSWSTAVFSLSVTPPPNFTISVAPVVSTVVAGAAASYTVTVSAQNGFTGTVGFGVSGLPFGAQASFASPTIAGSGSTTMTVSTALGGWTGTTNLILTGNSGDLHNPSPSVDLIVQDFTFTISPTSQTVPRSPWPYLTLSVGAINGFSQQPA